MSLFRKKPNTEPRPLNTFSDAISAGEKMADIAGTITPTIEKEFEALHQTRFQLDRTIMDLEQAVIMGLRTQHIIENIERYHEKERKLLDSLLDRLELSEAK